MNAVSTKLADNADAQRIVTGEMGGSVGFLLRLAQVDAFEDLFAALATAELKPGEFSVLWVVSLNPDARQGTIAEALRIKRAHMTKLVARLIDRGLLIRVQSQEDRRAVRLEITDEGRTLVDRHRDVFFETTPRSMARLSGEEADQFIALLQKMTGLNENAS